MDITLAKDVEEFLKEQLREGVCSDVSDLVNDVLRALRDQRVSPFAVTPELESWLLEAADQPASALTAGDFTAIRERTRNRLKSSDQ